MCFLIRTGILVAFRVYYCVLDNLFNFGIDLYRHIGDSAELVVIKKAGHALNIEKPNEMNKLIQGFLVDSVPSTKAKVHHQNDLKSE